MADGITTFRPKLPGSEVHRHVSHVSRVKPQLAVQSILWTGEDIDDISSHFPMLPTEYINRQSRHWKGTSDR